MQYESHADTRCYKCLPGDADKQVLEVEIVCKQCVASVVPVSGGCAVL
jgi:hypothetical protein